MIIFKKKLNILVLGSDGMLGYDVYRKFLQYSYSKSEHVNKVIGLEKHEIEKYFMTDTNEIDILTFFRTHDHFDYVINCVAMTDTNAAENTKEGRDLSYKLNVIFPQKLAEACREHKSTLIHISTDYVFSEKSFRCIRGFFACNAEPFPVNVYGTHKLLGEMYIKNTMKPKTYAILRTSWLYGHHNEKSFIHKFIANAYKCMEENRNIEVTENEYSVPTSTFTVIQYIKGVLYNNYRGIIHAVCSSKDYISRFEFAKSIASIYNNCITKYHLDKKPIDIDKIVAVKRENKLQPTNSYMRTTEIDSSYDWDTELEFFIKEMLGIAKNSII